MQTGEIKEKLKLLKTLHDLGRNDNARQRVSSQCGVATFSKTMRN